MNRPQDGGIYYLLIPVITPEIQCQFRLVPHLLVFLHRFGFGDEGFVDLAGRGTS
ncbi:MAG: hypothetical protein ACOYNC_17915 [Bacteroidales bacterium]